MTSSQALHIVALILGYGLFHINLHFKNYFHTVMSLLLIGSNLLLFVDSVMA